MFAPVRMCFTAVFPTFDVACIKSIRRQKVLALVAESRDSTSVGIGFGGPIEAFAFFRVGISGVHYFLERCSESDAIEVCDYPRFICMTLVICGRAT